MAILPDTLHYTLIVISELYIQAWAYVPTHCCQNRTVASEEITNNLYYFFTHFSL